MTAGRWFISFRGAGFLASLPRKEMMKSKLPLRDAEQLAQQLCEQLKPYCHRVEIAGSIRRCKGEVGDIDLLALPIFETDMFGNASEDHKLNGVNWELYGQVVKNGNKYKQIALIEGVHLELSIVTPPAQWGTLFLIRTGPEEFSHRFVKPKRFGGMLPSYLRVKDGAMWSNNHIIPTPEEADVFGLIGIAWVPPELRS